MPDLDHLRSHNLHRIAPLLIPRRRHHVHLKPSHRARRHQTERRQQRRRPRQHRRDHLLPIGLVAWAGMVADRVVIEVRVERRRPIKLAGRVWHRPNAQKVHRSGRVPCRRRQPRQRIEQRMPWRKRCDAHLPILLQPLINRLKGLGALLLCKLQVLVGGGHCRESRIQRAALGVEERHRIAAGQQERRRKASDRGEIGIDRRPKVALVVHRLPPNAGAGVKGGHPTQRRDVPAVRQMPAHGRAKLDQARTDIGALDIPVARGHLTDVQLGFDIGQQRDEHGAVGDQLVAVVAANQHEFPRGQGGVRLRPVGQKLVNRGYPGPDSRNRHVLPPTWTIIADTGPIVAHRSALFAICSSALSAITLAGKVLQRPGEVIQPLGEVIQRPGELLQRLGEVIQRPGEVIQRLGEVLHALGELLQPLASGFTHLERSFNPWRAASRTWRASSTPGERLNPVSEFCLSSMRLT